MKTRKNRNKNRKIKGGYKIEFIKKFPNLTLNIDISQRFKRDKFFILDTDYYIRYEIKKEEDYIIFVDIKNKELYLIDGLGFHLDIEDECDKNKLEEINNIFTDFLSKTNTIVELQTLLLEKNVYLILLNTNGDIRTIVDYLLEVSATISTECLDMTLKYSNPTVYLQYNCRFSSLTMLIFMRLMELNGFKINSKYPIKIPNNNGIIQKKYLQQDFFKKISIAYSLLLPIQNEVSPLFFTNELSIGSNMISFYYVIDGIRNPKSFHNSYVFLTQDLCYLMDSNLEAEEIENSNNELEIKITEKRPLELRIFPITMFRKHLSILNEELTESNRKLKSDIMKFTFKAESTLIFNEVVNFGILKTEILDEFIDRAFNKEYSL